MPPWTMSHVSVQEKDRKAADITSQPVLLSVTIEQALEAA